MQDSLESTLRQLVKEAVKEALLEARDSFEFASRQAQPTPKVEKYHEVDSESGERLIDSREASKMLAVSVATIERLNRSGAIPSIKIGNLRRYSIDALKQWIHNSQSTGESRTTTGVRQSGSTKRRQAIKAAVEGECKGEPTEACI